MQQSAKIDGHESADMGTGGNRPAQAAMARTGAHAKDRRVPGTAPAPSASVAAAARAPVGRNGVVRAPRGATKPRQEQKPEPTPTASLPARSRLTLERVLGVTALSNAMIAVNPVTGELAYAAGCIVVVYNLRRNKQVRYYRVDKSVACLCFSPSGQFLAIGEKGYLPSITIWDGTDGTLCAELQRHQYGIACMAFSGDGRYLLSVGLVHDQHIYAWELTLDGVSRCMKAETVAAAHVEDKVMAADYCQAGKFFVTVGEKHFKYWFLDDNDSFLVTGLHVNDLPELQHRDAVISAKTSATFTGVGCGYGTCKRKTFAVTADGTLCCFGASGIMERLVSLEAAGGNALSVTEAYVAVGGSSGIMRLFDPSTLEYRATMPFPPAFGTANEPFTPDIATANGLYPDEPHRYPAVTAVRVTGSHVITLYSDRSLFIYGIAELGSVTIERSFLFHSGGIRDVQVSGRVRGINAKGRLVYYDPDRISSASASRGDSIPNGTFVTCSDDNTVRLWHLELHRRPVKSTRFDAGSAAMERPECEAWKNPFSQEMLRVIYNDEASDFMDDNGIVLGGTCSHESTNDIHSPAKTRRRVNGLRTVAIRPDQRQIAAGDREGNVVVVSLPFRGPNIHIGAHSSEVSCLSYGMVDERGSKILMASGGRDRLVHLYDCSKGHAVVSTLENHEGAITAVAFTRKRDKLLSCGADKNLVFSDIDEAGKVAHTNAVPFVGGKIFDMTLSSDNDIVVTACNNRLDVLNGSTGKRLKAHHVGEQHHLAICPANFCVAISGSLSDRTIHVVNIETGEALATGTGHGEAITALKFTPDCRRLLSTSGDGCIFVWRLSEEIQSMIKDKLPRVVESQEAAPVPPMKLDVDIPTPTLPPPAPPISSHKKIHASEGVVESTTTTAATEVPVEPRFPSPKETPAKEQKRPGGDDKVPEATAVAVIPAKGEPKPSPVGSWKGNAVAVPGPMADIPMEDWMRTRESAKPTIQVTSHSEISLHPESELASAHRCAPGAVLSIDRSQTPDWAKTDPPAARANLPVNASPPADVRAEQKAPAGEKWSNQATPVLPKQARRDVKTDGEYPYREGKLSPFEKRRDISTRVGEHGESGSTKRRKSSSTTPIKEDELIHLSVRELKINTNASTSLALEREKLEKRKKQMNTAKAVAAMNTRLSQLGLLRPQHKLTRSPKSESKEAHSPPRRQDDVKESHDTASLHALESGNKASELDEVSVTLVSDNLARRANTLARKRHLDIPMEMFESIEIPSSAIECTMGKTLGPTEAHQANSTKIKQDEKSTDDTATLRDDSTMQQYSLPTPAGDDHSSASTGAASGELVDQALNELSQEYATARAESVHSDVGASLSAFTAGYDRKPPVVPIGHEELEQGSTKLEDKRQEFAVAASLSSFTSGFKAPLGRAPDRDEVVQDSVEVKAPLVASVSAVTSGYAQDPGHFGGELNRESESAVAMDMSMSTFTAGYQTAKTSTPDKTVASVNDSASDWELVGASYSNLTSGYEVNKPTNVEKPSASIGDSVVEGLPPQTESTTASLSAFTTGYGVAVSPLSVKCPPGDASARKSVDVLAPSPPAESVVTDTKLLKDEEHGRSAKQGSTKDPIETFALKAIRALDQPLLAASTALVELVEGHDSNAGPELQEVQRLAAQLREAIGRLGPQLHP